MQEPKDHGTLYYYNGQPAPFSRTIDIPAEQIVRPRDAVISCAHFWAFVLVLAGIVEAVIGAMILSEWESVGSLWVGVAAISAGVAGACVMGDRSSGGPYTGFFIALSLLTLLASIASVMVGDGITYLVVMETGGNCFDASTCSDYACAQRDCVCWEPDGTRTCAAEARSKLRYCLRFAGNCADIGGSENLLLGSTIMLLMISSISLFAFLVAVATCCCCKRIIIVEPISNYATR